jgi:hypothetical protein
VVDPLRGSATCVEIAPTSVKMEDKQSLRVRDREEEGEKIFIDLKGWYVKLGDSDVI